MNEYYEKTATGFRNLLKKIKFQKKSTYHILYAVIFIFLTLLYFFVLPPLDSKKNKLVNIPEGANIIEAGDILKEENVIRSPSVFALLVFFMGDNIYAGDYFFERPRTVLSVASRLASGDFSIKPFRITLFEGETVIEMADRFDRVLENFDRDKFITQASPDEGYLFPDTYFFPYTVSEEAIIKTLKNNYQRKVENLRSEIRRSGYTENEIIVMASLLEKEASDFETKQLIAGVLWKRLEEDMRLQVDAVFPYIIGKNTFEVTLDDLDFDSPYNTYLYKGLPPGPIGNPGLDSIKAALNPIESEYWYYLADMEGVTHFSETFEEHVVKKRIYLP